MVSPHGKPRRTVDLQALNKHAARETHHTASPFLQARSVPALKKKTIFDTIHNGYCVNNAVDYAKKNDVLPTILSTEFVVSNNRFLH